VYWIGLKAAEYVGLQELVENLALAECGRQRTYRFLMHSLKQNSMLTEHSFDVIQDQFEDKLFVDLLFRLLEHDPRKRITAAGALRHKFFNEVKIV